MKNKKHICIVGDGAAGWIAYHSLKNHPNVSKITVIGSPSIPKIGVGESTTLLFSEWLQKDLKLSKQEIKKFLVDIDAAIKYGVNYEGWGSKPFLHHLNSVENDVAKKRYTLGTRPENISHNDAVVPLADQIYQNKVYLSNDYNWLDENIQSHTYHFDAGKFIQASHELAKNDTQLNYISATVVGSEYNQDKVEKLILESGEEILADYYISCIGQTSFNQKVFKEEYISYSDYLLTNKALFCPLEFTDPVNQFHPYTVAKTMPHGWRWITPTRSRIGTGYVFSENHITVDQAVDEFRKDAGMPNLEPFLVDFWPRRVKEVFKPNMCTLGMASGFQEPLDAPGLNMTFSSLNLLKLHLDKHQYNTDYHLLEMMNRYAKDTFDFWCSFILHQYKTCHRNDTKFWIDHKNVEFDFYNLYTKEIFDKPLFSYVFSEGGKDSIVFKNTKISNYISGGEPWMFYNTSSGKDIKWKLNSPTKWNWDFKTPKKPNLDLNRIITHREYIDNLDKF